MMDFNELLDAIVNRPILECGEGRNTGNRNGRFIQCRRQRYGSDSWSHFEILDGCNGVSHKDDEGSVRYQSDLAYVEWHYECSGRISGKELRRIRFFAKRLRDVPAQYLFIAEWCGDGPGFSVRYVPDAMHHGGVPCAGECDVNRTRDILEKRMREFVGAFSPLLEEIKSDFEKEEENMAEIEGWVATLRAAKQVVFTGAPGTGKTYLARQIARSMVLSDEEKQLPEAEAEKLIEERTKFVQFHPSYDYTDFVEGLRPIQGADGQVGFRRQDGTFKKLCKAAIAAGQAGGVDNFEEAWTKFVDDVKDRYSADKPLELTTPKSDCTFRVFVNRRGNLSFITSGTDKVQGSLTKANLRQFYVGAPVTDYWECYFKGVIAYLQDKKNGYGLKAYVAGKSVEPKDRQKFVIIIDEINRGDISKIFGELFYAIDDGYRGPKGRVETQYQNLVEESDVFSGGFYVLENVYIIGTMNDVDRNVESMDFAIRRRFTWEEIEPNDRFDAMMTGLTDSDGVEVPHEVVKQAKERMKSLNTVISDTKNGLGPAYQIGPSYFAKIKDYSGGADEKFKALWDRHLRSLLYEYLRGMERVDETMAKLKDAYDLKNSQGANVASETDFPQQ